MGVYPLKHTLEDGVLTIHEGVKRLEDGDFSYKNEIREVITPTSLRKIEGKSYCGAFSRCDRLEKVTLQPGVQKIGMMTFNDCKSLREISIPATVQKIEPRAFNQCDSLAFIVVPGMALHDLEYKPMAALGYCVQPERFTDSKIRAEYEEYIPKHLKAILNRAKQFRCEQAIQYMKERGWYVESKLKLTAREAVLEIERAILDRDAERVEELTAKYPSPELTARALGFACRVADPKTVQHLLDCGYTFAYDVEQKKLVTGYGLNYKASNYGSYYWADFAILPVYENVWDKRVFGKLEKQYIRGRWIGYDGMMDSFEIPSEFAMAEEHVRAENLELVCRNGIMDQKSRNLALYYSVLRREYEIMSLLQRYGAVLDASWLYRSTARNNRTRAASMTAALCKEKPEVQYEVMSQLMKLAVKPVMISDFMVNNPDISNETLELMLSEGDTASVNMTAILRQEIESNHIERAAILLKHYELSSAMLVQLTDDTVSHHQPEMTALLLDYGHKHGNSYE